MAQVAKRFTRPFPETDMSSPPASVDATRTTFLGLRFDAWSQREVLGWLSERETDRAFAYVVTPNVDHVVRLAEAPAEVRRSYDEAALVLCDSRILARLARWAAGVSLPVVPGSDLTAALFDQVLRDGDVVCLVGGGEGDGARLEARRPGIRVVQHRPPLGLRGDPAARARAVDAAVMTPARFTLFAVGSPQQELIAHEMAARAGAGGTGLCIGASTDFLLGRERRAPRLVQRLSLEWAWRLLGNPRRLARRYLVEGPAIFPMAWRWRRERRAAPRHDAR